jgi:hypothetical protein
MNTGKQWENMKEIDRLEDFWLYWNMILKCNSNEQAARVQERDKWETVAKKKKDYLLQNKNF